MYRVTTVRLFRVMGLGPMLGKTVITITVGVYSHHSLRIRVRVIRSVFHSNSVSLPPFSKLVTPHRNGNSFPFACLKCLVHCCTVYR